MIIQNLPRAVKKQYIELGLIIAASILIHLPSFSYYFFQDDWFVLNWVKTDNLASFFQFRTDIIYWRPVSMPMLFKFASMLFGLNALGFHLISFCIFILLIFCVHRLFKFLVNSEKLALFGTFLYGTWHIHFMSLSWFSTTSYLLGPLFGLLTLIFFLVFAKNPKKKPYLTSFLFFTLSLLTSEFSLVVPFIIFCWGLFLKSKNYFKYLLPYFILAGVFLFLRFVVFPVPAIGAYKISLNTQLISNYTWYLLWSLNFPEGFKDIIFFSQPASSIKVLSQFWFISLPTIAFAALITKHAIYTFKKEGRNYLFGWIFFTLGLLPVLTVVNHSYAVYISLAGIGLIYIFMSALKKAPDIVLATAALIWVFTNFQTLRFNRFTHWVVNEQAISRAYINLALGKYKTVLPNAYFLIRPSNIPFAARNEFVVSNGLKQVKQALNDQDALRVIYDNSSLNTIYAEYPEKVSIQENSPVYTIDPGI